MFALTSLQPKQLVFQAERFVVCQAERELAKCYFSEVLNMGIKSVQPLERVGHVEVWSVEPSRRADPPIPSCPLIDLSSLYAVISNIINSSASWGYTSDSDLNGLEYAMHKIVRQGNCLTRDELAFLLYQVLRWRNFARCGAL